MVRSGPAEAYTTSLLLVTQQPRHGRPLVTTPWPRGGSRGANSTAATVELRRWLAHLLRMRAVAVVAQCSCVVSFVDRLPLFAHALHQLTPARRDGM
jgi:hypothetical protein